MSDRVSTWIDAAGEEAMQAGHGPSWNAMIDALGAVDLSTSSILDYGCNRGGFLRLLHRRLPFQKALGVDIAEESLAAARAAAGDLPVSYDHIDALETKANDFDVAFSHEVIYLLPDLAAHAAQIHRVLKPGGAYFCAIGEYEENPLWPKWKALLEESSAVQPYTYSSTDIAAAFLKAGFTAAIRPLACTGFAEIDEESSYFASPFELAEFHQRLILLYRFTKPA